VGWVHGTQRGLRQRDGLNTPRVRPTTTSFRSLAAVRRLAATAQLNILVTGAGGRTGALVLDKLLAEKDAFTAKGMVSCA
jgi:phage protein U